MVKWLYDHYALTGFIALYYMVLIGYGTVQVFSDLNQVTGAVAAVYGTLMGLPAAAAGLIKWRLGKDNVYTEQVSSE